MFCFFVGFVVLVGFCAVFGVSLVHFFCFSTWLFAGLNVDLCISNIGSGACSAVLYIVFLAVLEFLLLCLDFSEGLGIEMLKNLLCVSYQR